MIAAGAVLAEPMLFHAHGVVSRLIDDAVVVFDERSGSLHELNPTAGMVWELLDGNRPQAVRAELSARFDVPEAVLADDVDAVIESFLACGLLSDRHGGEAIVAAPPPTVDATREGRTGCWPERLAELADAVSGTSTLGPYQAGDLRFVVTTDDRDVADELRRILRSLEAPTIEPCEPTVRPFVRYFVVRRPTGWSLLFGSDGQLLPLGRRNDVSLVVSTILWHLNQQIVARCDGSVALHAGAISGATGAAIFPGVSNAGKSTLVAGLVRSGYGYLSDEIAMLDPETFTVAPIPKALAFDPGSFAVFPDAEPTVAPPFAFGLARKWHVDPEVLGHVGEPGTVRIIVAPQYSPSATPALERLTEREALDVLIGSAFRLDASGFAYLATLATTVPAYRLTSGDLDATLALIEPLLP